MRLKFSNDMINAIGLRHLERFGVDAPRSSGDRFQIVNLARYAEKDIQNLIKTVEGCGSSVKGLKAIAQDSRLWLRILSGEDVKPKNASQFEAMLQVKFLESAARNLAEGRPDGPRVYRKENEEGLWDCYYVTGTRYVPEQKSRDTYTPAHAIFGMTWLDFDKPRTSQHTFYLEHIAGKTVEEALGSAGYYLETPALRAEYERRRDLFNKYHDKIGKQFLAVGNATDDCDGNTKGREDSWYWRRARSIHLDKSGEPARVVMDVLYESEDDSNRDRRNKGERSFDRLYWYNLKNKIKIDDDGEAIDDAVDLETVPEPEIPIHPFVAVFDMKRHLRLRLDVGQLTEYVYDSRLGDKLVLPPDSRNLVEMLLAHKGQFRDIVAGKSGGALILCAGIPGTGKTLTAEVYAEVMARPLYTVQASQLGLTPEDLEDELLKTFARSQRWNAIMLIDEADVYVHTRGNNLQQNAIVGVFLRVLEYYKGVLFMTTNRSDLVDDAIASRCVARIDYTAPDIADQKAIWRVLATSAGIKISDEVINAVAERYPDLTGRDVKNLLKLAKLVSEARECPITLDVLRFVKRFKPTVGTEGEKMDTEPVSLPAMPVEDDNADTEVAAESSEEVAPKSESIATDDWRTAAAAVFEDGAPHATSEVREAVKKLAPDVHHNAVTTLVTQMVRAKVLERLDSGLYRKAA